MMNTRGDEAKGGRGLTVLFDCIWMIIFLDIVVISVWRVVLVLWVGHLGEMGEWDRGRLARASRGAKDVGVEGRGKAGKG